MSYAGRSAQAWLFPGPAVAWLWSACLIGSVEVSPPRSRYHFSPWQNETGLFGVSLRAPLCVRPDKIAKFPGHYDFSVRRLRVSKIIHLLHILCQALSKFFIAETLYI